ncbi:MAG: efflux RND transporter permease subunit [Alphaproteobacteria bacterium]|nr:efflux RND transporter permease subunit [Alphaproteobacteria bacterium]
MNVFSIFIRRPVLASVISLLILVLGLRALFMLPVRQYPEMSNTVITVTTTYPGADADLMQGFVTDPVQKAVATSKGIDYLTSSSALGVSEVKVFVRLNDDPGEAMTEVMSKVNEVRSVLPRGINDPVIKKTTGEAFAAMYLAFSSDKHSPQQITDYVSRTAQPKLATVPGVANPEILGGQKFSMRVWLDPQRLAQYEISPAEVKAALSSNNFLSAAGSSKGGFDMIGTQAKTDLKNPEEFRDLVIRGEGAKLVRLGDVANVELGPEYEDASVYVNGKKAVFIGINLQPGSNPLDAISGVREVLPSIAKELPEGMGLEIAYDSTVFIRSAIWEVVKTLIEATLIVIGVIFLFMGSVRAVMIPVVTVPLSLIGAALFMLSMGYSINLLTLLAMVLAIGLVVDDAIVVVENVHRHIEEGLSPFEAALKGTREISGPVIAMTLTLAAVYAPIAFMGGLTGALFKEFAFTLAGSVIVSGVVALTLSPMMCSKILAHETNAQGLAARIDALFARVQALYGRLLAGSMKDRPVTVIFAMLILISLWPLYQAVPTELAPEEDKGAVMVAYQGPPSANLDYMETFSKQLDKVLASPEEAGSVFTINGFPTRAGGFAATILKPWDERKRGQKELVPVIQAGIDGISGIQGSAFGLPPLPGSDGLPVQFVITSTANWRVLSEVSQGLLGKARQSGMFAYVDLDLKVQSPQTVVEIDRDKAGAYGVTMQAIGEAFATMTGGNYVNLINMDGRSYQVIPQVSRDFRTDPQAQGRIHVKTAGGAAIPLSSLVKLSHEVRPVALSQFNQLNSVTLQAFPMPGVSLGTALAFLGQAANEVLPKGMSVDYAGQSRQYYQEGNALMFTFFFALIVIFLVLAAQFESFRDPLVILVSVPLSICGALIPLALGVTSMNIYTQVGLVTLIGLISKHGILICEVAKEKQQAGMSRIEAVQAAAQLRLRPILMTTAAMVVGLTPLLIASGAGAASRLSIAIVIVAGMSIGTLFTLFVLPVVYSFVAAERQTISEH